MKRLIIFLTLFITAPVAAATNFPHGLQLGLGVSATGGLNIADEYINKVSPFGHWKDAGVRIEGDGAFGFALIFLQMHVD